MSCGSSILAHKKAAGYVAVEVAFKEDARF
jgi:hypothetical protein